MRDHAREDQLHNPDDSQLFPDMFPACPLHPLHHPGGHRSRHQDQDDRSGQFPPDGRGEAVHPRRPQRGHRQLHSARPRGLEPCRVESRERPRNNGGQCQVRQVALLRQRDLHVLRRHILHHNNADLREKNGDHRQ